MDMMPYEDFDVLEQRVRDMVKQHRLPPEVTRVDVKFGDRQDGEPAVWVELHIPDNRWLSPAEAQVWASTMTTLSDGARRLVPGRMASTRYIVDPRPSAP